MSKDQQPLYKSQPAPTLDTLMRYILYVIFFVPLVFADLPGHEDLVVAEERVSAPSDQSIATDSDILILISPASEQYTLLSESSLSSVTEITKLLQNAFVSAISTEANTQTSQQLYSLELLNSALDSLTVSEPLRELLKSYTQILMELLESQPPKPETLALAMIHAFFLESLYEIRTLPDPITLSQSTVIQNHPLFVEMAEFAPLLQSQSRYNRLQLLEKTDQLEIFLRQYPGVSSNSKILILSALRSFAEGKEKIQEQAQHLISHQNQNRENHQTAPRSGSQFISMPDLKLSLIQTEGDARVRLTGTVNWCGTTYGGGGACWPHDWLGIYIAAKHSISGQESWYLFRAPLNTRIFPGAKVDIQTETIFAKLKQHLSIQEGKYKVTALWGSNNVNLIYVPNFSVEWEGVNYIADGAIPPEGMTVNLDTLNVTQEGGSSPAKSDKIYLSTKRPVNLESRLSKTEKFTQNDQYEFEFLLEIEGKTQSLLKRRINSSSFTGGNITIVSMNLLPLEMKEFDGKDGKITSSLKRLDRSSNSVTISQLIGFNPPLFVKVLDCDEPKAEVAPTDGVLSDYYNVLNCNFEVIGDPDDIEFYIRVTEHTLSLKLQPESGQVISDRGALTLNLDKIEEPLIDGITTPDPAKSSLKTRNKKFSFRFVSRPVYFTADSSDGEYPYKTPVTPLVKFHVLPETSPGMPFTTRPAIFTGNGGSKITSEIFPVHQPREIITSHQGVSNPLWFSKSVEQLLEHYKNVPYVNQVLRQLEIRYGMEKKVQRDIVDNPFVVKLRYAHLLGKDNIPEGAGAIFKPGDWYSIDVPGEIFVETFGAKVRRNAQYSGVMTGIPPEMSYKHGLLNVLLHELRHAYQQVLAYTAHTHNPDKDYFVPCRTLSTLFSAYGYGQCDKFKNGLTIKGIQKFQEIDHGFLIDPVKYQVGEQTANLGCNLMPGNQFVEGVDNSKPGSLYGLLAREADAYYFGWWFSNHPNDKTPLPIKTIPILPLPQLSDPPANPTGSVNLLVTNPPLLCELPINTFYKVDQDWIQSEDHSIPLTFHKVANQCVLQNGSIVNKTEKTVQVQFRGAGDNEKVVSGIRTATYSFSGLDKIPQNVKSCDGVVNHLPAPNLQENKNESSDTKIRIRVNNFPESANRSNNTQIQIFVDGRDVSSSFNYSEKFIDVAFNPKYAYCTRPGFNSISVTKKQVTARFLQPAYAITGHETKIEVVRPGVEIKPDGYTCSQEPSLNIPAPIPVLSTAVVQTQTFQFRLQNLPSLPGIVTQVCRGGTCQRVSGSMITIPYTKRYSSCTHIQNKQPQYSHQKNISLQYFVPGQPPGPVTQWAQRFSGWDFHPGTGYQCY